VGEQYGPLNEKMKEKSIDMSAQWFWIDIICLDQQHPHKIETIKRSNEIYSHARYYFVMAWLDSTDCGAPWSSRANWVAKTASIQTWTVVVTDFEGSLGRREEAHKFFQLTNDPTFKRCRYTSATDVPLVEEKILAKHPDIAVFNAAIKNVADVILKQYREDPFGFGEGGQSDLFHNLRREMSSLHVGRFADEEFRYTFRASEGDENKCGRCDKLKEHHHTKKRDGTISMDEWCNDFLLRPLRHKHI
jgi:hypothetical protein